MENILVGLCLQGPGWPDNDDVLSFFRNSGNINLEIFMVIGPLAYRFA